MRDTWPELLCCLYFCEGMVYLHIIRVLISMTRSACQLTGVSFLEVALRFFFEF